MEQTEPRKITDEHIGEWFYGEGRIGKSHLAGMENPEAYWKPTYNTWWCGYRCQKTVIYDEFTGKSNRR